MLQMKTRQSLTLSGPKNLGVKSKVVRAQETMLLTGRDVSRPSLDKSPLDSSPRSSAQRKNCCNEETSFQEPLCQSLSLWARVRCTRARGCPKRSIVLLRRSQKMFILLFMLHCAASYGPKFKQPIVLKTRMFARRNRREAENMVDKIATFDTYRHPATRNFQLREVQQWNCVTRTGSTWLR
jgi:hypothetical protein